MRPGRYKHMREKNTVKTAMIEHYEGAQGKERREPKSREKRRGSASKLVVAQVKFL